MKGLAPAVIAILVVFFVGMSGALMVHTFFGMTVERSISASETEVLQAINKLELVKEGLPYALEYSFSQAVYVVSKNGGYFYTPTGAIAYRGVPVWNYYGEDYSPNYISEVKKAIISFLGEYAEAVKDISIPRYENIDFVCGGKLHSVYTFKPPSECNYGKGLLGQIFEEIKLGDITYSEHITHAQCAWSEQQCFGGIFSGVKSDTIQFHVDNCKDEYFFHGDNPDYSVSSVEVKGHAYIWASGEPYREASWALECCLPGTDTSVCNSDANDGNRFHANNIFSAENKDQIGSEKKDKAIKKFNLAWCGKEDRNCLLCHTDLNDRSKTKWYVCGGGEVPENLHVDNKIVPSGVKPVAIGEKVGNFECGADGQWTTGVGIDLCKSDILTVRASSSKEIIIESESFKAYENPDTSTVVKSNVINIPRIAKKNFLEKDWVKEVLKSTISEFKFDCATRNETVISTVYDNLRTSFEEEGVSVRTYPTAISIDNNCNSTVAAIAVVYIEDTNAFLTYDRNIGYRNPILKFSLVSSSVDGFKPDLSKFR